MSCLCKIIHCTRTVSRQCRRIVHCQADRARELTSRRELPQNDRHADEATADARDIAVTGHLRPNVEASKVAECR